MKHIHLTSTCQMLAKIILREALTVSSKQTQGKFYLTFSFMANLSRFCGFERIAKPLTEACS